MNTSRIITSIITFILLLSLIPVIFNLNSGFRLAELIVFVILLVFGTISVFRLLAGANAWLGLFVFNFVNAINLFVIYTRTFDLCSISIPMLFTLIGFYISAFSLNNGEEEADVEPYYEEYHEVEKPKKAKKKKKAK